MLQTLSPAFLILPVLVYALTTPITSMLPNIFYDLRLTVSSLTICRISIVSNAFSSACSSSQSGGGNLCISGADIHCLHLSPFATRSTGSFCRDGSERERHCSCSHCLCCSNSGTGLGAPASDRLSPYGGPAIALPLNSNAHA